MRRSCGEEGKLFPYDYVMHIHRMALARQSSDSQASVSRSEPRRAQAGPQEGAISNAVRW